MFVTDIAISAMWIVFWATWLISATTAKKTARSRSGNWLIPRLIFLFVFLIVFNIPSLREFIKQKVFAQSPITDGVAVLACALGLSLAVWARVPLGTNWGMPMTMREEPELVTSGPYRFIRHPIYSGILLAFLGSSLIGSMAWLMGVFLAAGYFLYSAITEEKLMTARFPDQYSEYKKRTKMFIPYIL